MLFEMSTPLNSDFQVAYAGAFRFSYGENKVLKMYGYDAKTGGSFCSY